MRVISFDCATKTFAYSIMTIDIDIERIRKYKRRIALLNELYSRKIPHSNDQLAALNALKHVDADINKMIIVHTGDTLELFPGIKNKDISMIDRIKEVTNTCKRIKDRASEYGFDADNTIILLEFQMGQNVASGVVFDAIVAYFCTFNFKCDVIKPSYKNKLCLTDDGHYSNFAEKYCDAYGANKAHTKFNLNKFIEIFGICDDIKKLSEAKKGHIADAIFQALAYYNLLEKG